MRLLFSCIALSICLATQAFAAVVTFQSKNLFEDVSGDLQFENFNADAQNQSFQNRSITIGELTFFADVNSGVSALTFNKVAKPPFPTASDSALAINAVNRSAFIHVGLREGDTFTMAFLEPIYKFGTSLGSINDSSTRTSISVAGETFLLNPRPVGATRFFGLISDTPFSSITFSATGSDGFGIDNVLFSNEPLPTEEIPLPASLPLMATGLALFGLYAKRKRTAR